MLFNSTEFLIFFPIVILIYFIISPKLRYLWLLFSSYYFYMCWNAKYILLLMFSTITTWLAGVIIEKNILLKKAALVMCVVVNVGILFFYKYLNFFIDSINRILNVCNLQVLEKQFDILLPVGISFYTFQALGYIFDIYKGKIKPEKNILRYALFVSFFPQLVAGPIERTENLLKQTKEVENLKLINYRNIVEGLILMIWGLFVKMVIADRIAILVNHVFDNYNMYGTIILFVGAVGFALQIYCDFMGYSTVAVGAAKVMGFTLMENFETPYFAKSVSEFWRRWHISLSSWLRDYVYIPLGGNRCSKVKKYFNLMVTFCISGLWHGANWTFVVWGFLHGIYQIFGDLTKEFRNDLYVKASVKTKSFSFRLLKTITTFLLVDFAWIFFRAESLEQAIKFCKRLFTKFDPWTLFNGEIYTLGLEPIEINILLISIIILFLVELVRYYKKQTITAFLEEQCTWFKGLVVLILVLMIVVFGIYGIKFETSQFIYFQF